MSLNSAIEYFINPKDKESPENHLKGRFFVVSISIFFLLCFSAIPYYAILRPEEIERQFGMFIFNILMLLLIVALLWIYKKFGKRILLVNFLTALGYLGNVAIYEGGGIFAVDNMWGILIASWVFLLANKRSGFVWFAMIVLQFGFFYYAELNGWRDFSVDLLKNFNSGYYFFNYMLASLFLMLIIYLHEKSKDNFLAIIVSSRDELEKRGKELSLRNKDVTDSINYAKKIQTAVLPHEETINRSIPLSFILYKPKDIVSGDFYWFNEIDKDNYIIICADCTGHGVPGAFMTVIGSNLFNQTVIDNKIYEPGKIMVEVDRLLNMTLKQDSARFQTVQDGMDLSILRVNKSKKELLICSAKRPVIYISQGKMQDFRGNKYSLGGMREGAKVFEEIKITYKEEDVLYFFTDGYHDQFGGEKGKKYSSKRLKEFFYNIHQKTMPEQKQKLNTEIENWQGNLEQVDDICVIGIRF